MNIVKGLIKYRSRWIVKHWRRIDGVWRIIWEEDAVDRNILHDAGEQAILSSFFVTALTNYGAPPASIHIGLDKRVALAEGDTLATLDEIASAGYERKAVSTAGTGAAGQDWVITQPAAYYLVTSKTVTWTAGENWSHAVKNIFLATDLTAVVDGDGDHLICSLALSADRTLLNGDKLEGSMVIGLSE